MVRICARSRVGTLSFFAHGAAIAAASLVGADLRISWEGSVCGFPILRIREAPPLAGSLPCLLLVKNSYSGWNRCVKQTATMLLPSIFAKSSTRGRWG
jgi:hypothetical protein